MSPSDLGANTPMKVYSYLDSGRPVLATRLPTHTQVMTDDIAELADPNPQTSADAMSRLIAPEASFGENPACPCTGRGAPLLRRVQQAGCRDLRLPNETAGGRCW